MDAFDNVGDIEKAFKKIMVALVKCYFGLH